MLPVMATPRKPPPAPAPTPPEFAAAAISQLTAVLTQLSPELIRLAQRVTGEPYPTEEGKLADAGRLCEMANTVLAILKTIAALRTTPH